jgi:hypothetical protein
MTPNDFVGGGVGNSVEAEKGNSCANHSHSAYFSLRMFACTILSTKVYSVF